jgi:cation diffusion facilitator CzcD-associated flavoprotein CzcO
MPDTLFDTVVIGGGQAGLAVGYYLKRQRRHFAILEAHHRLGESWRRRWDSLRLFTSASLNALPGMPFPAPAAHFPTKDEMAGYLEAYAARFELPVQLGVRADALTRDGDGYGVTTGAGRFRAGQARGWTRGTLPDNLPGGRASGTQAQPFSRRTTSRASRSGSVEESVWRP